MKIHFTKAEFRVLMDMIYLGDWMLSAHDTNRDPSKAKHAAIAQKILACAKEMGCEDLVELHELEYFPTAKFEAEVMNFVDAYNESSFWQELVNRLADRDLARLDPSEKQACDQPFELAFSIEHRYSEEFAENGLERLTIDDK